MSPEFPEGVFFVPACAFRFDVGCQAFAVHFRHGTNPLVRAKPYAVAAAVAVLSPVRGGRAEAGNVLRAMRDARGMRSIPGSGPPAR